MTARKAYIFDMDGTLISYPVQWEKVRDDLRRITDSGAQFSPVFPTIEAIIEERPDYRAPIFETIDRYELEALPQVVLLDGAHDALSALSKRGKMSLVTMQGRRACSTILEKFSLMGFFQSTFTREDSFNRATQLEMALKTLGVEKDAAVFVGDRINDLVAAQKVGIEFVMIRARGDKTEADTVFGSMREFYARWVAEPAPAGPSSEEQRSKARSR